MTTKLINKAEGILKDESMALKQKSDEFGELFEQFMEKSNSLKKLDTEILDLIDADKVKKKVEFSEEIQEKILQYKCKIISLNSNDTSNNFRSHESKVVKLPKLIVKKFYGDSSSWLEF